MKKIILSLSFLFVISTWFASAQITSYPYLEDFESGDGGWIVDAANAGSWALGAPAATIINSADSGTNAWVTNLTGNYVSNEVGNVISPVFDFSALNAPSIQMSVWWNAEFSWDGAVLQSSIDGGTSWQNVGAFNDPNNWFNDNTIGGNPGGQSEGWTGRNQTSNGSEGWVVARHALIGLGGESNVILRVSFGSDSSVEDEGFGFDTVSVFEVTCPDPFAITVDAVTENSAEITWTPGGSETSWEIAVQDAGTGAPVGAGVATMDNNPYNANTLNPSTAYEVYIRSNCDTNGFSSWVGPINFTTLNTPPPPPVGVACVSGSSSFIFSENFDENPPVGWTGTGFDGSNGNWDIANANANSFDTGPENAYDGGTGTHLEYEAGGNATDIASAVSPMIDLTDAEDGAELSFFFHAFGADIGTLNVGVANDAAGPFTTLFTWIGDLQLTDDEAWVPVGVNLDAYLGQQIYIEFSYGGAGTGFEGDMAIDFVRVETCGAFCISPSGVSITNITGTSADIDWNPNNGETTWEYVVVPAGSGEPSGSGTVVNTLPITVTGLDFSTEYEVWVRADCGGEFSAWSLPVNFTTTIQSLYTIDCTQTPVNITYCYDDNDTTNWTFTSSDGSPLRLAFNSGGIESCCDDILVYEGTDNTGAVIYQGNNGGDLSGLLLESTTDSMYFEIDSDGSVSCAAGSGCCTDQWDFTVSCATCVNPSATYSVVSNCVVGPEFFVDVDITSLGSATSLTLSDDQGSATQNATALGVVQFGPYPNNTPVVITINDDNDSNCQIMSPSLTQELCLDTIVDCTAGPIAGFLCYGDNDSDILTYTSSDGSPLNLTINTGEIEGDPFDFLQIADGNGTILYNGEGDDGTLDGLTFQSITDTITIQVLSDGSVSCEAGSFCCSDGIDFTVACATCINPQATYQVVDDCDNGDQFLIDVIVSSLGDANTLTISNNIDATTESVSAVGTYQIGPFPFLVDVVVTVSNDDDANCVINSAPIQLLACPPVNNNPCDAIVAVVNDGILCEDRTPGSLIEATASGVADPSCGGNPDDDVWFQFVANSESQLIALANIAGSTTTDIDHSVYSGDCNNLTEIACVSDFAELSSVASGLTVGETYFIRIYSGGSLNETTTFDLCITPYIAPENVECDLAEDYCSGSDASDILYSYNTINVLPGFGNIDCLGTSPNPTFNLLRIATSGDILIEMVQNTAFDENDLPIGDELDVDFILWGPYAPGDPLCDATTGIGLGTIVDCSYSAAPVENVTLLGAQEGEIYLLLITNFEEEAGVIQVRQTNAGETGAGTTVADLEIELGADQELCGFPNYTINIDSPSADRFEVYANGFFQGEITDTTYLATPDPTDGTNTYTYTIIAYNDGCDAEAMDSITITFGLEAIANPVPDIVTCDDISADEIEDFDLEIQTAGVLGTQSADDFNITYHLSLSDAQNNIDPIASPFTNTTNPQTIYVRVEDANADFCFATTSFDLIISGPTPTATSDVYPECDDDSDGLADFDLPTRDAIILGGQSAADFTVTYYATLADAEAGTNPIDTSMLYNSANAIIYARVESNTAFDCYATTTVELVVNPGPDMSFMLMDLITCDDASADGVEDFDLESQTATVIGTQNPADFNVTYHLSLADAQLGIGALTSPYTNVTNPQTIYVRVENANVSSCYGTASFDLIISGPQPDATSVPIEECEDANIDGVAFFDLAAHDVNVLNGQDATIFDVSYHVTEADAEAGINPIDTSVLYESPSQTIYARVESNVAVDCYSTTPFDLIVKPLPRTTFSTNFDYEVCPDTIEGIIITATPDNYTESEVSITWYRNGDPIPGENGLDLQVFEGDFYQIEVTFNDATSCSTITEQEVIQLDNCVIPQGISPNGDGSNDRFDLSSFNVSKLEIFNRNGTLVYSKTNYKDEWFGQSNDGEELPVGTYFYTMEYDNGKQRVAWVYIQRLN